MMFFHACPPGRMTRQTPLSAARPRWRRRASRGVTPRPAAAVPGPGVRAVPLDLSAAPRACRPGRCGPPLLAGRPHLARRPRADDPDPHPPAGSWTGWQACRSARPARPGTEGVAGLRSTELLWWVTATHRRPGHRGVRRDLALIDPGGTRSTRRTGEPAGKPTRRQPERRPQAAHPPPEAGAPRSGGATAGRSTTAPSSRCTCTTRQRQRLHRKDVPALLRGIYRYHTHNLGWSDIGYNFLVDRFGRTWQGRAGGIERCRCAARTRWASTAPRPASRSSATSRREAEPRGPARRSCTWRRGSSTGTTDRPGQVDRLLPRQRQVRGGHEGAAAGHRRPPRHQRHRVPGCAASKQAARIRLRTQERVNRFDPLPLNPAGRHRAGMATTATMAAVEAVITSRALAPTCRRRSPGAALLHFAGGDVVVVDDLVRAVDGGEQRDQRAGAWIGRDALDEYGGQRPAYLRPRAGVGAGRAGAGQRPRSRSRRCSRMLASTRRLARRSLSPLPSRSTRSCGGALPSARPGRLRAGEDRVDGGAARSARTLGVQQTGGPLADR